MAEKNPVVDGKCVPGSKDHKKQHMAKAIKKAHKDYKKKYSTVPEQEQNPYNSMRM